VSEPKRYEFRIRACDCVKREHLEGKYAPLALIIEETKENCGWVSYEDYARLKAEVERLTSDLQMEKENEDRLVRLHQDARNEVERVVGENSHLQGGIYSLSLNVVQLKDEVERLTKAGDAMEMTLQADFNGCPYEPTIVREAMIYWRNAKGVQS
jgi:chromosome segregation ATPase